MIREWRLIWKPMNEIMDSVVVQIGEKMGRRTNEHIGRMRASAKDNDEMTIQYLEYDKKR